MTTKKARKTLVTTSNLSKEDKRKFRSLLETMATRHGGKAESYLLLLGYNNYPNLFSFASSKEMVDNPEQILLEVELYKEWVKLKPAFKNDNPFRDWLEVNPIYQDFLKRQEAAGQYEERTGHTPMEDFIANIGTSDAAMEPPKEESETVEQPADAPIASKASPSIITIDGRPTFSAGSINFSPADKVQTSIMTLSEALDEEKQVMEESVRHHTEQIARHQAELNKLNARIDQNIYLKNTLRNSFIQEHKED